MWGRVAESIFNRVIPTFHVKELNLRKGLLLRMISMLWSSKPYARFSPTTLQGKEVEACLPFVSSRWKI